MKELAGRTDSNELNRSTCSIQHESPEPPRILYIVTNREGTSVECEGWSFESPARTSWVESQWARTGPWKRDPSAGFAGASPSSATMPHLSLPPELLDHVVDNLSLTRDALKTCCLVSESWIPRARKHLFANIEFLTPEHLQSWKNLF